MRASRVQFLYAVITKRLTFSLESFSFWSFFPLFALVLALYQVYELPNNNLDRLPKQTNQNAYAGLTRTYAGSARIMSSNSIQICHFTSIGNSIAKITREIVLSTQWGFLYC